MLGDFVDPHCSSGRGLAEAVPDNLGSMIANKYLELGSG
jgi:hypothetical protein